MTSSVVDDIRRQFPQVYEAFERNGHLDHLAAFYGGDLERGLGDYTERLLSSIGLTQERFKEAKELFGFAPFCRCPHRKEWLNRVGKYFGIG